MRNIKIPTLCFSLATFFAASTVQANVLYESAGFSQTGNSPTWAMVGFYGGVTTEFSLSQRSTVTGIVTATDIPDEGPMQFGPYGLYIGNVNSSLAYGAVPADWTFTKINDSITSVDVPMYSQSATNSLIGVTLDAGTYQISWGAGGSIYGIAAYAAPGESYTRTSMPLGPFDPNLTVFSTTHDNFSLAFQVIGVAAPVPEPETYAMLLAGLGLIGAAVARRKEKQA